MKYHFFALITWFLGLLALAKGIKLISLAYPAEKLVKFKRFTSWFLFIAASAGLICIAAKSFYPMEKGSYYQKGCTECPMMKGSDRPAMEKK